MLNSGITYMHEHVYIDLSRVKNDPDTRFDDQSAVIGEFIELKKRGVANILEVTNTGMGQNIPYMQEVARASGLNLLFSTGFYQEMFHPPYLQNWSEEDMYRFFLKELREGIGDTTAKAQAIAEVASSEGVITPTENRLLRAAIRAHIETGAALSTHTSLGTMGKEQVSLFLEYTRNLSRVVIGHCDLAPDEAYLRSLLDSGVTIAFDTIGKAAYKAEQWRADTLASLAAKGYQKQIVLSMDITRKSHLKKYGGLGYCYLLDAFIPMLKERGVPQDALEDMLIRNPQSILMPAAC